ncbi:MAG TPA: hypothetical protein DCG89_10495 [Spartobacteria bacterium]|nr:hypothetical protein [Spartobacteria bacterium]
MPCCLPDSVGQRCRVNAKNFFAELKRRNVYKVAIAYAIVAWLLVQVATSTFPVLEIPNWAIKLVIALVVLGFPVAMVIAWAFELTSEGLKRTETANGEPVKPSRNKAWVYVVIVAAALSIGLFFVGRYSAPNKQSTSADVSAKSIAVLPFENLSEDKVNAYFADGIQEEILTRLAKISALKVISRTSTQQYQSKPGNLPEIAKQLGVANILEGSVQRSADQVRVNVQLIKAAIDAHLWADTFDRKLTDIFAVESEIAKTIAETLQAKLSGSEEHAISVRPTDNPVAHQLYLKGRFFWNKRTGDDLKKSIDYFNRAITADPKYALAYAGVADAYVLLPAYGGGTPQESYPLAKAAAKKALEIDDTLAEAHTSLGLILCFYDLDFASSIKEFERAIALNPNYATAHHWYGNGPLKALGRFDEAIAEGKRAVELDPLSLINNADLGDNYYFARRYDDAIEQLRKTLEMDPGFYDAHWTLGKALEVKGALEAAIAEYQKARALNDDPFVLGLLGHAYASSGNKTDALKILDQLKELSAQRYVSAYSFALVYIGLGDKGEALRWLEQSYQDHAGNDIGCIKVEPLLDPLRGDPRFEALVEKIFGPQKNASPSDKSNR